MDWEVATFTLSVVMLIIQGIIAYTIVTLKLWVTERFVSKQDFKEVMRRVKAEA